MALSKRVSELEEELSKHSDSSSSNNTHSTHATALATQLQQELTLVRFERDNAIAAAADSSATIAELESRISALVSGYAWTYFNLHFFGGEGHTCLN